uniref:Uncharacterized protein n=1 Tax=Heterosigma akashiwo TaxID=2829 RepID=A0A7S4D724_HETAK|mmetsp:Transcript_23509/g.40413  ORF Transcript_23509/g.40413 Transcript_23509/m.40413 type:complete len:383 (-) Transcript_23509:118-1266(-)
MSISPKVASRLSEEVKVSNAESPDFERPSPRGRFRPPRLDEANEIPFDQSFPAAKSPVMPLSPTDAVISPTTRALCGRKGQKKDTSFRKAALNNAMSKALQQNTGIMHTSRLSKEQEIMLRSSSTSRDVSMSPPNYVGDKESLFALPIRPKPLEARNRRFILGSSCPKKEQVLREAGWVFDRRVPPEDYAARPPPPPGEGKEEKGEGALDVFDLAVEAAAAKARAIAADLDDGEPTLILCGTQLVVIGDILDNNSVATVPETAEQARAWLRRLSGGRARTVSALAALNAACPSGAPQEGADVATLFFDELAPEAIERILQRPGTYTSAGAMDVRDPDIRAAVNHVDGEPDSVFGLPLDVACDLVVKACREGDAELVEEIQSK